MRSQDEGGVRPNASKIEISHSVTVLDTEVSVAVRSSRRLVVGRKIGYYGIGVSGNPV